MGWSKATRIKVLLAIDTIFLFIELITGYAVGSLALVADSFHMLNDVMSLIVALYALNLASNTTRSNKYSYGWQRAEILGALVNGVFLLALCFSIFMEAIQRLFEAPEVGQPKLVVVVGSLGLLSNIVGLFLFHEHGHSHGGHSHSHDSKAEEGHSHAISAGNKVKQVKHKAKGALKINTGHSGVPSSSSGADERSPLLSNGTANSADPSASPLRTSRSVPIGGADTPFADDEDEVDDGLDELMVHPARTREAIVRQAYDAGFGSPRNSNDAPEVSGHRRSLSLQGSIGPGGRKGRGRTASTSKPAARERSASRSSAKGPHNHEHGGVHDDGHGHDHADGDEHEHHEHEGHEHDDDHEHEHEHGHGHGDGHGHGGHDHGNMNMRGVFLHVMGDALGNVGVIAAGLIIWLTKSPYRFYSDPLISLVITIIIFSSALPLVRSASFILLQGTPAHVPLEKVRSAILRIPNVISVHDLHIWSLSESKLVASMHILVKSHTEFAVCSAEVRKVLHRFGVHSTTIQPELLDLDSSAVQAAAGIILSRQGSLDALVDGTAEGDDVGCLVQCVDDSCVDSSCCPPNVLAAAKEGALASANTKSHSNLRQNAQAGGSSKTSANGGPSYASIAASK